jgi:hypothetical protein
VQGGALQDGGSVSSGAAGALLMYVHCTMYSAMSIFNRSFFDHAEVAETKIIAAAIANAPGHCTVCSNGFYVDISNQHQVQQYKSCLK